MINAWLSILLLSTVNGQANVTGSCLSGPLKYDFKRMWDMGGKALTTVPKDVDISTNDFIVEYGAKNIQPFKDGGFTLQLKKNPDDKKSASGVKLSSSRYVLYGRITALFSCPGNPGVITSFITMSDVEDEIDWEITGKPNVPQSNVFYHSKGKTDIEKEIGIHGGEHPIDDTSKMHTYVIDWKHDSITWSIDGKVVRTLMKEKSFSKLKPLGPKWFPTTPSLVQFALWDGGYPGSSEGTRNWAGGAIDWGSKQELVANYESVMIECYDEKDNIVPKWPLNTPDKKEKTAKSNDKGGSNGSKTTPQGSALRHSSVWLAVASVLFSLC